MAKQEELVVSRRGRGQTGHNKVQVKQNLIGSVRFIQANLLKDVHLKVSNGFDIIFCHNL